jgi:hypothetical protein
MLFLHREKVIKRQEEKRRVEDEEENSDIEE